MFSCKGGLYSYEDICAWRVVHRMALAVLVAFCPGDAGPDCFKGNDQPFCRIPCLALWRQYCSKHKPYGSYDLFMSLWTTYDFSRLATIDASSIPRVKACTFGQSVWDHAYASLVFHGGVSLLRSILCIHHGYDCFLLLFIERATLSILRISRSVGSSQS